MGGTVGVVDIAIDGGSGSVHGGFAVSVCCPVDTSIVAEKVIQLVFQATTNH